MVRFQLDSRLLAMSIAVACTGPAWGAVFASRVESYDPGPAVAADGFLSRFTTAAAALGAPDPITGERETGFPNVLNPFSPAYETDEIVVVGEGGRLRLALPNYANVTGSLQIGVISNAGLQDASFTAGGAAGTNFNPARGFGGGTARVAVSENGVDYISLGSVTFNAPANYYTNLSDPYASSPPPSAQPSDFGQPFSGTLASFDGKDFAQTIAVLGGSGGGTWLDLSATGLSRAAFIEFSVDDTTGGLDRLAIDAVVIANGSVGPELPEPASVAFLALATPLLLFRPRRD